MRAKDDGETRKLRRIRIRFDDEALEAIEGESISAALHAAGKRKFRRDRLGRARGLFCGMGVCQECLVIADDVAGQRACMTAARDGMTIRSQPYAPAPATAHSPPPDGASRTETPDILIIGAGAAGLSAARAAAMTGAKVTILDERPAPGGQFFKQLANAGSWPPATLDRQMLAGAALIGSARDAGAELIGGAVVWGAFSPREIAVEIGDATRIYAPARLILATGAYERGIPIQGWTLPGAMTTGAAQTLLRAYRVLAGRRIVLAGNGPLNLQVAVELMRAGAEIVAIAESAPAPGLGTAGALLAMARAAPDLIRDGLRYRLALARRRIPVLHGHVVERIEGAEEVRGAVLVAIDVAGSPVPGTERRLAADTVCLGYGFMPQNELARALGCRHVWDSRRRHLVAIRDAGMRSTVSEIYVAGDAGGLGGARAAMAEGTIAGIAAARAIGKPISAALERSLLEAKRERDRALAFQEALWTLYRAPGDPASLRRPDDIVCRCEDVSRAAIAAAMLPGADIGAIKRATRAGMGRCQGRYCGPAMAEALAAASGETPDERAFFAPRFPAKPVPLASIARREEQ